MKKSVLIMDDDLDIRLTMADILRDEGYAVESAQDGREGLDILNRMHPLPGLIILDLMMPNVSGDSFLNQRSQALTQIPIAYFSADSDIQNKSKLAGVESIRKPVNYKDLLAVVKKHCD